MAHYRFSNLLGAPYRGGNLCIRGNHLLTSVGNRVTEVDLHLSSSTTLPSENLTEIECIAVSPTGSHMISFDTDGRAILVNLRCARPSFPPGDGARSALLPIPNPPPRRRVPAEDDTQMSYIRC